MGAQPFTWTPRNDAHLRALREDGCTLSEMARELRTSQSVIRARVREQEAEEAEAGPVVVGVPGRIHEGWFIERGAE